LSSRIKDDRCRKEILEALDCMIFSGARLKDRRGGDWGGKQEGLWRVCLRWPSAVRYSQQVRSSKAAVVRAAFLKTNLVSGLIREFWPGWSGQRNRPFFKLEDTVASLGCREKRRIKYLPQIKEKLVSREIVKK
jgi:hypothetical protein